MGELLPCVQVDPSESATAAVIWLHGLGANGHDFEPLVPMLDTPGVRYVFPHAPARPVTINYGMVMPAWYDIRTLDFDAKDREDPAQIAASAQSIAALIEREYARGIKAERIVLAGFSQGAALAMHVAARWPDTLAGLMALSGYLLLPEALPGERHPANLSINLLQCHGRQDDIVPIEAGRMSFEAFKASSAAHAPMKWLDYPMGHELCPAEVGAIAKWLRERLA